MAGGASVFTGFAESVTRRYTEAEVGWHSGYPRSVQEKSLPL